MMTDTPTYDELVKELGSPVALPEGTLADRTYAAVVAAAEALRDKDTSDADE